MHAVIDGDWTLVTRNSDDFRPRRGSLSQTPCYIGQPLHAGLICLNLPAGSARADQVAYFQAALAHTGHPGDMVNKVLEVNPGLENLGEMVLQLYDFPEDNQQV